MYAGCVEEGEVGVSQSTFWTDNIKASLEVVEGNCKRLPAGELLTPAALNEILDLFDRSRQIFLLQCELQGFTPNKPK